MSIIRNRCREMEKNKNVFLPMPTPQHFNKLSEAEQYATAMDGHFLADRQANGQIIQLFSLPNYYVERYYDPAANRITRHEAFDSLDRLVPYIAHVKFNGRG